MWIEIYDVSLLCFCFMETSCFESAVNCTCVSRNNQNVSLVSILYGETLIFSFRHINSNKSSKVLREFFKMWNIRILTPMVGPSAGISMTFGHDYTATELTQTNWHNQLSGHENELIKTRAADVLWLRRCDALWCVFDDASICFFQV